MNCIKDNYEQALKHVNAGRRLYPFLVLCGPFSRGKLPELDAIVRVARKELEEVTTDYTVKVESYQQQFQAPFNELRIIGVVNDHSREVLLEVRLNDVHLDQVYLGDASHIVYDPDGKVAETFCPEIPLTRSISANVDPKVPTAAPITEETYGQGHWRPLHRYYAALRKALPDYFFMAQDGGEHISSDDRVYRSIMANTFVDHAHKVVFITPWLYYRSAQ